MFAGSLVVFVRRARTAVRQSILDRNQILVVLGIRVTGVANEDALRDKFELEGFVLGALERPLGRFKSLERMC